MPAERYNESIPMSVSELAAEVADSGSNACVQKQ